MAHRRCNRKPLTREEAYRLRSAVRKRIKSDPSLLNLDDVARALNTSVHRVVESLGPDIRWARVVLQRRRCKSSSYEVTTNGERPSSKVRKTWTDHRAEWREQRPHSPQASPAAPDLVPSEVASALDVLRLLEEV